MVDDLTDIIRSLRRSRSRVRVLDAAAALGRAPTSEIATLAGVTTERVLASMEGRMPGFRRSSSLVALGLFRRVDMPDGPVFEPTEKAYRVLRALQDRPGRGGFPWRYDGANHAGAHVTRM